MKISVVMTSFNGASFIKEQMESIRTQTVPADEVIIADDHSSDSTATVINEYIKEHNLGNRWKLLINDSNQGLVKNIQNGVRNTSGDIIFYADQDDVWLPDKIKIIREAFLLQHDMMLLCSNYELVDKNLKKITYPSALKNGIKLNTTICRKRDLKYIYNTRNLAAQSMAFRRSLYNTMSSYYTDPYFFFDTMIATFAAAIDGFYTLDIPLTLYRQHDNNTSGFIYSPWQFSKKKYSRISAIEQQLFLLKNRLKMLELIDGIKDMNQIKKATYICQKRLKLIRRRKVTDYIKLLCMRNPYLNKKWILGDVLYLLFRQFQ